MKKIGKGRWIVVAIVLALAVGCLCNRDIQAFLGGVVLAGIILAVGFKKSKHGKSVDIPPVIPMRNGQESSQPISSVPIAHDLGGSSGSSFGSWDVSIHAADGQDVRMDRALNQNIVFQSYDSATGSAVIRGTHGDIYQTNLDRCTCEDFQRRGLPCKHIYKLALSRGYSVDAFFSVRTDVVWYADGCRVYHANPDCRGLWNRYSRRSTVSMAEYNGLRPCKTCCGNQ